MSGHYAEISGLHVYYGNIHALHGIDMYVDKGEIVSVVGVNGAGKSTLMWTLAGVLPYRGSIEFDGSPLPARPHETVIRGISLVPERRRLFTALSVRENLIMGAIRRHDRDEMERDMERCFALYPVLKERMSQRSGTLSGGEQQMLAISRALMSRPRALLLDEPSLGLAPKVTESLFDTISQIRGEGVTVLMVEQNAYEAMEISDRCYVLQAGTIAMSGNSSEIMKAPQVRRAYLGDV
ncbi:MAG: ABC transporter ATP-binding protein [Synergistaceae bacterium]|jgi:branched-chain amino acid transport system ATP-binding protein|nr:ABC transporter ATP-binding protein [Synergistaceae bacterium]